MNYDEASSVKELAAPVMKVLEGLELECPKTATYITHPIDCHICNGTGKAYYSYTPQVGEWIINEDKYVDLIAKIDGRGGLWTSHDYEDGSICQHELVYIGVTNKCIPILHWEEIERVLEKAGYGVTVDEELDRRRDKVFSVGIIWDRGALSCDNMYSRQEAVCRAVIALGEMIKIDRGFFWAMSEANAKVVQEMDHET